jgi:hypothetical protein
MQTLRAKLMHVNPWRTAVTMSLVALVVWIPLTGVMEFFRMFDTRPPHEMGPWWFPWVAFPTLGMFATFIVTALTATVFNLVSRATGGVPYRTALESGAKVENASG